MAKRSCLEMAAHEKNSAMEGLLAAPPSLVWTASEGRKRFLAKVLKVPSSRGAPSERSHVASRAASPSLAAASGAESEDYDDEGHSIEAAIFNARHNRIGRFISNWQINRHNRRELWAPTYQQITEIVGFYPPTRGGHDMCDVTGR